MQRFCQTMDLYDDPELIAAYVAEHNHVWEEVKEGFRTVGISTSNGTIPGWAPCPVRQNGKPTCLNTRKPVRKILRMKNGN